MVSLYCWFLSAFHDTKMKYCNFDGLWSEFLTALARSHEIQVKPIFGLAQIICEGQFTKNELCQLNAACCFCFLADSPTELCQYVTNTNMVIRMG